MYHLAVKYTALLFTAAFIWGGAVANVFCQSPGSSGKKVEFLNQTIEETVRAAIEKETGPIYKRELQHVSELKIIVEKQKINLKDVEPLTHLVSLRIKGYAEEITVESLQSIRKLRKLETLHLNDLNIKDLSADLFKPLEQLENVELKSNNISDLSFLSSLQSIQSLNLFDNSIQNISDVSSLNNIRNLNLGRNQIKDISPLKNVKSVEFLRLSANQINDISPLKHLNNLKTLELTGNQIENISPLKKVTSLRQLFLAGNQIHSIKPLKNLTELQWLRLSYNNVKNLSPLRNLRMLERLNIRGNPVKRLVDFQGQLKTLNLLETRINDIHSLSSQDQLQKVYIDKNHVDDLSPLYGLEKLELLSIGFDPSKTNMKSRTYWMELVNEKFKSKHFHTLDFKNYQKEEKQN